MESFRNFMKHATIRRGQSHQSSQSPDSPGSARRRQGFSSGPAGPGLVETIVPVGKRVLELRVNAGSAKLRPRTYTWGVQGTSSGTGSGSDFQRSGSPSPGRQGNCVTVECYDDDGRPRSMTADSSWRKKMINKQRYLGTVELLISFDKNGMIKNMGRFRIEPGEITKQGSFKGNGNRNLRVIGKNISSPPSSPVILENPEKETRWYFKYFLGKVHQNYAGVDQHKQPFFFSIVVDEGNEGNLFHHRAILWTNKGSKKLCLPYNYPKPQSAKSILRNFAGMSEYDESLKEIISAKLQKELLILEEQEGSVNFKFGVIYANSHQKSDEEMFSNEHGDESFANFLQMLGEEVQLEGWNRFKGGLDTKSNSTGTSSVYTVYEGHEIMFHVSTMLPYSKDNAQQIERKRHVGNDIVNIIFEDGGDPENPTFNPSMMKSHFTHIFALVTYSKPDQIYRLWVFSEDSVPVFGPPLPNPPVFIEKSEFRDFLLTKLINGEKAAFDSKVFAEKRERTMDLMIKDMYIEYLKDANKALQRVDSVFDQLRLGKLKKDDQWLLDFIKLGQSLKLEKVLSGDAPTSLATTGFYRKQPWEPEPLHAQLSWPVFCSDYWTGYGLLCAPESGGLFLIQEKDNALVALFDKSVSVRQLNVVDAYGICVLRAEKGKENTFHVFKLETFHFWVKKGLVKDRATLKEGRIEATKGCQIYAVSEGLQLRLHVAVGVGHHLKLYQWKYSVSCPVWCINDHNLAENFELMKEFVFTEDIVALSLFECQNFGHLQACVGYKSQFDIVNTRYSTTKTLYKIENKISFANIIDNCDEDEAEVLISYNNVSALFDLQQYLKDGSSYEPLKIYWNSVPVSIVYIFPFIIAFTKDTIEIRLAVNGNLLATLFMPCVQLLSSKGDIYFCAKPFAFCNASDKDKLRFDLEILAPGSTAIMSSDNIWKTYRIRLNQLLCSSSSGLSADIAKQPLEKQRSNPHTCMNPDQEGVGSGQRSMDPPSKFQRSTLAPGHATANLRRSFNMKQSSKESVSRLDSVGGMVSPSAPPASALGLYGTGSGTGTGCRQRPSNQQREGSFGSDSGVSCASKDNSMPPSPLVVGGEGFRDCD